jgi:hypothetical protein
MDVAGAGLCRTTDRRSQAGEVSEKQTIAGRLKANTPTITSVLKAALSPTKYRIMKVEKRCDLLGKHSMSQDPA